MTNHDCFLLMWHIGFWAGVRDGIGEHDGDRCVFCCLLYTLAVLCDVCSCDDGTYRVHLLA